MTEEDILNKRIEFQKIVLNKRKTWRCFYENEGFLILEDNELKVMDELIGKMQELEVLMFKENVNKRKS